MERRLGAVAVVQRRSSFVVSLGRWASPAPESMNGATAAADCFHCRSLAVS